jgi:hypothetical protein
MLAGCITVSGRRADPGQVSARVQFHEFLALAKRGLRSPFRARYLISGPDSGAVKSFRFWSAASVGEGGSGMSVPFVYEDSSHGRTFRFVQRRSPLDFGCLSRDADTIWRCWGPIRPWSIGSDLTIRNYELPLLLVEEFPRQLEAATASFFRRSVHGIASRCAALSGKRERWTWCVDSAGHLTLYEGAGHGAARTLRLVATMVQATSAGAPLNLPAPPASVNEGGSSPMGGCSDVVCRPPVVGAG